MYGTPLIIGCDSFIGRALFQYFNGRFPGVIGTSRRPGTSHLFLNLEEEPTRWQIPKSVGVAYLCAAITNVTTCERDALGAHFINVERIHILVDKLLAQGIHVVFLSSDLSENPTTEYGVQKLSVEQYLQNKDATVVRLGKVISAESGLLCDWVEELEAGRPIEPFDDYYFSPISMKNVLDVLGSDEWLWGYWKIHISAIEPLSYFQAIDFIAAARSLDRSLIFPKSSGFKKVERRFPDLHSKKYCFNAWDTLSELFQTNERIHEDS